MEELKKILVAEQLRCAKALSSREPSDESYARIVHSLYELNDIESHIRYDERWHAEEAPAVIPTPDTPPAVEPTAEPPLVEVPKEEPAPIEMPSGDDSPFEPMSFDEFRAAAIKASESMSIRPFLEKYCPKGGQIKLSAVPEESRAAMVEELRAAVVEGLRAVGKEV